MTLREWLLKNGYAREVDALEAREQAWREAQRTARKPSDRMAAELIAERYAAATRRLALDVAMAAALRGPR